jgi:hypothetical protein
MGEKRKVYRVLVEKPEERDHSDDLSEEGRMGSLCMLGRLDWGIEWRIGVGGGLLQIR